MFKYEIMTIVDPKADVKVVENLLSEVFAEGVKKVEKLERNELAYEINKSKHAQYVLALVETEGENIAEFTRKANIIKEIWRNLVINLDTEKGLGAEPKKARRHKKASRDFSQNNDRPRKRVVKSRKPETSTKE
ncbi:30S ribosomal protein S6 [Mycoplasma sp. NEAQ87857]|uniref:30S ribosomal protein S6 n=1 Tax=Mycoplasma sp. NEAQ87857 TaxID=2683967 RepID=UPI0013181740|nr:30S ribosomal protein S6 [Mycoplasma sp. NEAQ87857]QGZ97213.1 30S ribosomal protein S6 [Mycoplasma sp. NEAQ87857]